MSLEPLRKPSTDEMKKIIASIEKALGCHILLAHGAIAQSEKAQEAAAIAAMVVCEDASPDAAWAAEGEGFRERLAELCGLKARWHPFKPEPCPLSEPQVSTALGFLRALLKDRPASEAGYDEAVRLITWAKQTALNAK